jgi:hypothetical protein
MNTDKQFAASVATAQMREVDGKVYNLNALVKWANDCKNDPNFKNAPVRFDRCC